MPTVSKVDDTLLRCVGCGAVTAVADSGLNCATCGNLLEVVFPNADQMNLEAGSLKSLWRERRASNLPIDQSGVWRFREVLPSLDEAHPAITLREGNTPLYSCRYARGLPGLTSSMPSIKA